MEQMNGHKEAPRQICVGRIAAFTLAVMGLTSFVAVGAAGAVTSHATKSVTISTVKNSKLGTILVSGKTVYSLKASKAGCTGACTTIWPMVVLPNGVVKATAGKGVNASKLGSVSRAGGVRQVTYGGQALYWFSGDKAAGQANGNGVKDAFGTWSVVVTVKPVKSTSSGSGTTTTAGSSGGYGAY